MPTLYLLALERAPALWLALNTLVQSFPLQVLMMVPPGCRKELMSYTDFPTRTYPWDWIMAALIPVPAGAEGVFEEPLFLEPLFLEPLFLEPFFLEPFFFFINSLPTLGSTSIAMTSNVANKRRREIFFEGMEFLYRW